MSPRLALALLAGLLLAEALLRLAQAFEAAVDRACSWTCPCNTD